MNGMGMETYEIQVATAIAKRLLLHGEGYNIYVGTRLPNTAEVLIVIPNIQGRADICDRMNKEWTEMVYPQEGSDALYLRILDTKPVIQDNYTPVQRDKVA